MLHQLMCLVMHGQVAVLWRMCWKTLNLYRQQFAGIIRFCFSNGFLTSKCFKDSIVHADLKMRAANEIVPSLWLAVHVTRKWSLEGLLFPDKPLSNILQIKRFKQFFWGTLIYIFFEFSRSKSLIGWFF